MAIQTIGIGSAPNDGTGDAARTAFGKVNDNFAELYGIYGSEVETQTFTSKQDDLAINDYTRILRWDGAGTTGITGLSLAAGRVATIVNASTDYLLWLENQNTASAATNRFVLPDGFPAFLMPGDSITVWKDGTTDRVRVLDWPTRGMGMGLSTLDDFDGSAGGLYSGRNSGTGSTSTSGTNTGADATYRTMGVRYVGTGTSSTGYGFVTRSSSTMFVAPTLGAVCALTRARVQDVVTAAEEFSAYYGMHNASGGTFSNGVCWEHRWNGSAAEMSRTVAAAGVIARVASSGPANTNAWAWLGVFINQGWTRADFFYSTNGISFTLDGSVSSGLPTVGGLVNPSWGLQKIAGSTDRVVIMDFCGHRVHQVRA